MNNVGYTGFGALVAIIAFITLVDRGVAYAQIEGALQYPPASVGEDAQPPPPARMVPTIVSPRRLELGARWSSLDLINPPYGIYQDGNRRPMQPAPLSDASPVPLLTEKENN
jgi:hypothetical protein